MSAQSPQPFEPSFPSPCSAVELSMDDLVTQLDDLRLSFLCRGLEQTYGCTIRKQGPYLWLGMVEFGGGMMVNPRRTVRDMWEGSKAMREAADEYQQNEAAEQPESPSHE